MPYKDLEKRRTYQRDYKRQKRARAKLLKMECQTLSNPKEASKAGRANARRKAYVCPKLPSYSFPGMIVFKNGIFVTDQSRRTKEN